MKNYILKNNVPIPCDDILVWGRWFEENKKGRHVGDTTVGDVRISTVFLGIDHSFGRGRPVLFETMIFGGEHEGDCWRWFTWFDAEEMHPKVVAMVKGEISIEELDKLVETNFRESNQ